MQTTELTRLLQLFEAEAYVLWYDVQGRMVSVCLKQGASVEARLKAWTQALLIGRTLHMPKPDAKRSTETFSVLEQSLGEAGSIAKRYFKQLEAKGWDLSIAALETSSGSRIATKDTMPGQRLGTEPRTRA